jgi:HKD family nuclease
MKVELHNENPGESLHPRLVDLVKDANLVEIAVAFVTRFGTNGILGLADRLKDKAKIRLLVSVLFPTDLNAIAFLAEKIDVFVHLGYANAAEQIHGQFHSKIIFIERQGQSRTVVVGSHNWTRNGLDGGNLEASLVVDCAEGDAVVTQTRGHIEACRRVSERFDRHRLPLYQAIQREFHPYAGSTIEMALPGFEPSGGIVILAEHDGRAAGKSGRLHFHVPTAAFAHFKFRTTVWIFLFPKGTLFGKSFPLPDPVHLIGQVGTNDDDPDRPRDVGADAYLIRDITLPYVEAVSSIPRLAGDDLFISVSFRSDPQPSPLPLFHAGNSLKATATFDNAPEREVYANTEQGDLHKDSRGADDRDRLVPTNVVAETTLKVPFRFAYPSAIQVLLESFGQRRDVLTSGFPYRVVFEQPKMLTPYICAVRYKSGDELNNEMYRDTES